MSDASTDAHHHPRRIAGRNWWHTLEADGSYPCFLAFLVLEAKYSLLSFHVGLRRWLQGDWLVPLGSAWASRGYMRTPQNFDPGPRVLGHVLRHINTRRSEQASRKNSVLRQSQSKVKLFQKTPNCFGSSQAPARSLAILPQMRRG